MQVLTSKGWKTFEGVKISHSDKLLNIVFTDDSNIECTEEHRFMLPDRSFIEAKDCVSGMIFWGGKQIKNITKNIYDSEPVYDLINVEDTHSYITNGVESHNCLVLDEFGIIPQKLAEEFFTAVYPTISSGKNSKTIVISTPKGYNHFYKMYKEAEQGVNGFVPVVYTWRDHPERDEAWMQEEIKILGPEKFDQEHNCAFWGTSTTLISSSYLRNMVSEIPVMSSEEGLKIYKKPEKNRNYFISVDPSRGTGNDNHAFTVLDITEFPYTIAATFSNNKISPLILPSVIFDVGKKYNDAYVLVEINDNGQQVADILWHDLEYENMISTEGFHSNVVGMRTTKKTKLIGCTTFKNMVESQKIIINDPGIISELSNFSQNKGSYAAESGTDDQVMTLVNFAYLTSTDMFLHISDLSFKKEFIKQQEQRIDEEILPFGFITDGSEDEELDISRFM